MTVEQTNTYAKQHMMAHGMLFPFPFRSRVNEWIPVTVAEMYIVFALYMLTGIVQKSTLRSYFSKSRLLSTPIFNSVISLDRFESITRFLHFTDNATKPLFQGPMKLFKISLVLDYLNNKFKSMYLPDQNIAIDESLSPGRRSVDNTVPRLTERHFLQRISPTASKARPQKRCVVCYKQGKRKESVYWCPDCETFLCVEECFKIYHTKLNF
ncbi:piggyBac transposable element-derived protein 4-like [Anabrus simplex]|uniref:piggyBac transposable element-derived protein 4-like n=1 Tax=Anabrus simplex TaxID=316456 RepID=UPI0035A37F52